MGLKDIVGTAGASIKGLVARLSLHKRQKPENHFDIFDESELPSGGTRSSSPKTRNLRSFLKELSGRRSFVLVAGGLVFLLAGVLARAIILGLPPPRGHGAELDNRELLLSLRIPEPPMPYDHPVLSRDPDALPTKEEIEAYAYRIPESAKRDALDEARAAVDAFFEGVR
jgi:hypothetical protein